MEASIAVPVPVPGLQVVRGTSVMLHTGVKEHHGVGRLADPVRLDDLADHAGLDKFHLCRAFRAQVGMPPHAYLTHLRIARAKELLRRGLRASDVAPLVGLYDQAQLTRHFRRIVGTTPARYARGPATKP